VMAYLFGCTALIMQGGCTNTCAHVHSGVKTTPD
jgi:hypothetical protein